MSIYLDGRKIQKRVEEGANVAFFKRRVLFPGKHICLFPCTYVYCTTYLASEQATLLQYCMFGRVNITSIVIYQLQPKEAQGSL